MTQLDLFTWVDSENLKSDLGGRCPWCLEHDNWITTDIYMNDLQACYINLECQTAMSDDDGNFVEICKATKEIRDEDYGY